MLYNKFASREIFLNLASELLKDQFYPFNLNPECTVSTKKFKPVGVVRFIEENLFCQFEANLLRSKFGFDSTRERERERERERQTDRQTERLSHN